jgi:hypothetical protein
MKHLALFAALFLFHQPVFADPQLNKCTDGKELTYTDKPCEKLGLQNAGPINRDTITILPALQMPPLSPYKPPPEEQPVQPVSSPGPEVYECTSVYGIVSYSSTPCKGAYFVPQLRSYAADRQQAVSQDDACKKINADPDTKARSSLTCPPP